MFTNLLSRTIPMLVGASSCLSQSQSHDLSRIVLPDGFEISVFADDLENARSIELADDGVVYVSTRNRGSVYAVVDDDEDGVADRKYTIATGLTLPNGIAYRNGSLFVSDGIRIVRLDSIGSRLEDPPEPIVVVDNLPGDAHHGWRYMDFGPDDRLYVSIGAPCNVCLPEDPYASIISMKPDGSDRRIVARGVRNSVGFTWSPVDGSFWFTDNGRDHMGDDIPSCELNRLTEEGAHFGFPFVHAGDVLDPEFGEGHDPSDYVAPEFGLGAHVAPLGIEFYTGDMFPPEYKNQLFVAEHGSWNRSAKVGYRVVLVRFDESGEPTGE
ncbi:MAG TPA: PQQ-dependent sugar dehydrogenase, partial [Rhodothermales bacterium]|nr:PQQ-dependent sugar dehydrogenase [Rhodothermales bacterium]